MKFAWNTYFNMVVNVSYFMKNFFGLYCKYEVLNETIV